MNAPASKIVAGMHTLSLVDQMAYSLRAVGYLNHPEARFAAYYRTGCDLVGVSFEDQKEADAQAFSIELARRLEGKP
jgi:hypothetical protein